MATSFGLAIPQGLADVLVALGRMFSIFELVVLFAFACLLVVWIIRVRQRAKRGEAYLKTLPDRARAIQDVVLSRSDRSKSSTESLATRLDHALGREEERDAPDIEQAIVELRNGLTSYADNISFRSDGRSVAHVRVTDMFSDHLPGRFVAVGRAMAVSRFSVQAGLFFSVLFILLALVSIESISTVTTRVAAKFAFTVLGLVASLLIQVVAERAGRHARQMFASFEDALEAANENQVIAPIVGSFRVLEQQTELNRYLGRVLAGFNEQIKALSDSAAKLEQSADSASRTLEAARMASDAIGKEIESRLAILIDKFGTAQDAFLNGLDERVVKATEKYTTTMDDAALKFAKETIGSGVTFKMGMDELGSGFNRQIVSAGSRLENHVAKASAELGRTAETACRSLDTAVSATLKQFSDDFAATAKTYTSSARESGDAALKATQLLIKAVEGLERSLVGAQTQFERFGEEQIQQIQDAADATQRRLAQQGRQLQAEIEARYELVGHDVFPETEPPADALTQDLDGDSSSISLTRPPGSDGHDLD